MTMNRTLDLRTRLLNAPLMMSQESAESFAALAPESFLIEDAPENADELMFDWMFDSQSARKPYKMVGDMAVIPVTGVLLHRFGWSFGFATGYDYVRALFDIALQDEDVEGIIFDIHSGGGQVDGCFELADHIYDNRGVKPSVAVVNAHAYSAAYMIASAAGKIVVPKTGGAGSIGVVTMHADMSQVLDRIGVKITFIHAGKHKVDGNPYQALPDDVRERIQARIDESYGMFVDAVARNRGLSTEAVKATEAQTFSAKEAVSLGLVDAVASPEEAMTAFVAELNGESKETVMAIQDKATQKAGQQAADAGGNEDVFTQADLDAAKAEGVTEGRKMERERFGAVMESEAFTGREGLAKKMLANGALSAEEINGMLEEAPAVEKPSAEGGNAFEKAMDSSDQPEVGAEGQDADQGADQGNALLRDYSAATGMKFN